MADTTLSIVYEMCHKLPPLLSNRVFPVLIVTAKRGKHAIIVVQIPIDIHNLTASMYSNGRNLIEGDSSLKRQKPVLGYVYCRLCPKQLLHNPDLLLRVYTSIESCQMLPDRNIDWVMATASDAKGWLPMWAQKLGVPGAVVKDVGLFITWIRNRPPMSRPGTASPNRDASNGTAASS